MDREKKRDMLLENFDIIKDHYGKNRSAMPGAVGQMFKVDREKAVEMWSYLITKHASKVKGEDSWDITGAIVFEGNKAIGTKQMGELVLNEPKLKKALFLNACDDVSLFVGDIIRGRINANELRAAEELLSLVYRNKHRNSSWYEVMDEIIPNDPEDMVVTEQAYELLEMWCDKVEEREERAKLSIKMMAYTD